MKKFWPIPLIALIGIAVYLLKGFDSESKNELNLAISSKVTSFDPAVAFNDDSLTIMGQVVETLYQYHYLNMLLSYKDTFARTKVTNITLWSFT